MFLAGAMAYKSGRPIDDCNIDPDRTIAYDAWVEGWRGAKNAEAESRVQD